MCISRFQSIQDLQIPEVHVAGQGFTVQALCFELSTTPQVFTRVFVVIARIFHLRIRVCLYFDNWLILSEALKQLYVIWRMILKLSKKSGFVVNMEKSLLTPSQEMTYLTMRIEMINFWIFPTLKQVDNCLSTIRECLSSKRLLVRSFRSFWTIGHLWTFSSWNLNFTAEKLVPTRDFGTERQLDSVLTPISLTMKTDLT